MKKIVLIIAIFLNCTFLMAQTEFDAFKMVQNDINGTARYMGMAGAFGALGGDASAIKDNPAGLGIYRKSELTGTMNFLMQSSSSTWNNVKSTGDSYKVGFNNFSYVIATPTLGSESGTTGLLSSNFSFSYNRIKDFNRSMNLVSGNSNSSMTDYMGYLTGNITGTDLTYVPGSYEPFDNTNIPWISVLAFEGKLMNETVTNGTSTWTSFLNNGETVAPAYSLFEKGYQDEYSIGWAGNISNVFFIGATVNLEALNYSAIKQYSETFGGGGSMSLRDSTYTNGSGINLKIGTIFCPTDFLRIGLSLHTPTVYALNDSYYSKLNFDSTVKGYISTPGGNSAYQIQSPLVLDASVAYIIGQRGLISAEYNYNNYTGTRLRNDSGDAQSFNLENQGMSTVLNDVQTIKIGGEYRLNDNFSVRAGYANSSNANKPDAAKLIRYNTISTDTEYFLNNSINYISAGFGYHEAGWFLDFAYMNKILNETFYPYNTNGMVKSNPNLAVNPAKVITSNNNIVITLGLKF